MIRSRLRLAVLLMPLVLAMPAAEAADRQKATEHYGNGLVLLAEGKHREAIRELRLAVHEDFKFADAHAKLAEAYSRLNTIEGRRLAVEEYRTAIRYDPDNADYYLELGKVHVAQTFDRYAEQCFRKSLEIDPDKADAYLQRGLVYTRRWLTWRQYQDDLGRAHDSFYEAYKRGLTKPELLLYLARASVELGKLDLAVEVLDKIVATDPGAPEALFLQALAMQEQGNLKDAEQAYLEAIARTSVEEKLLFLGIEEVASDALRRKLERMSPEEAAELARKFWREHDPNLATKINERLLEHWRRILKADLYFSVPKLHLRGRDSARGKSYIRYGPPTEFAAYIDDDTRPVEVWTYEVGGHYFRLMFRDRFLNGEFGFPFDPRGGSAEHWQALIVQFPQFYVPEFEGREVRLIADACSFFRNRSTTAQEIYYAVPGRELAFRKGEDGWSAELIKQVLIYDQNWRIVAQESTTIETARGGSLEQVRERTLVDQSRCDLPPGRYLAAISVEDTLAKVMGVTQVAFSARSFEPEELSLSDLQLARSIEPASGASPFDKGPLRIVPEPGRQFERARSVYLYYEIYDLALDGARRSHFTATVRVIPLEVEEDRSFWAGVRRAFGAKPRTPPHIASSFTYERESRTVPQHLALDLSPLRPGRYRLSVSVEDLVAKTTASRSTTLWITR